MKGELKAVSFNREFLKLSTRWLKNPELKRLTMTPDFTDEEQDVFFRSIPNRNDYIIYGVIFVSTPIGAFGLKNIKNESAEYWGYIGEKQFWGKGIGNWMLSVATKEALLRDINKIWLKVSSTNSRAISLYEKNGFSLSSGNKLELIYTKLLDY